MSQSLSQLTKRYLAELFDFQTVWATALGIKGFEGITSDLSQSRINRHLQSLSGLEQELSALSSKNLSFQDELERELLKSDLMLRQREWSVFKKYQTDPSLYIGELIYGLWYLHLRVESKEVRVKASIQRMLHSRRVFEAAQKNLTHPPKLWTQTAIDEAKGYLLFLKDIHRELLRLAPKRRYEIEAAVGEAKRVGEDFLKFLSGPLLKKSNGSFAVGEKEFNFLLKTYHHYSLNAAELLKIGRSQMAEIQKALKVQAEKIKPGSKWHVLVDQIKKKHPPKNKLLKTYQQETAKLRRFIQKQRIVSVPKGESLKVIETPVFTRNTIPYAAYVDPPMFGDKNHGVFFVTPVTAKNKKIANEILEEHNFGAIEVTALHEGYPGHHLQFSKQFHAQGSMMKLYNCSSFYEGWALYCEEMMYETGYYNEETRLIQLKDKLWRACRVVVDVSLHTKRMTDSQAVNFLAKEARMTKASARADVNWYTMRPTVPQSYLTGMLLIKKLREKFRKKLGKKFTLQKFHDAFLKYGAIPIPLVENAILN